MPASDPASLETFTMRPWPLARSSGSRVRLVCRGAEQIDLQGFPDDLEVGGAGALPGVVVDGGVVDQDVQPTVADAAVGAGDERDARHHAVRSAVALMVICGSPRQLQSLVE
jgi:hypothetical protein